MSNRIILGYPYSGAFYWLLSAEEWRKSPLKARYKGSHPYYQTLYGKEHNKIIDETASLAILYEEIYLSPADCYLPKQQDFYKDGTYMNTEIGVYTSWSWRQEISDLISEVGYLTRDQTIATLLHSVPEQSRRQILEDALAQLYISDKFDATIIASEPYLKVSERITEILTVLKPVERSAEARKALEGVNKVFELSSLRFELNSLEEFVSLRTSRPLKKYAESFRSYLRDLPSGELDELFLLESMLEAINTEETARKVSGGLSITASVTGLISLIPFLGTVAGAAGIATDAGGRFAGKVAERNSWWLLAPEIARILSKRRIEKRAIELRKRKGTA